MGDETDLELGIDFLESRARILEKLAKKEKEDLKRKAMLHYKAAEICKSLSDNKNWKWNMANYYSAMGLFYLSSNRFSDAREYLKKAEELFLDLFIKKSAFYCARKCISAFIREAEQDGRKIPVPEYFEYVKKFLEIYKDFLNDKTFAEKYIEVKISFYKFLSIKHRLSGDYTNAETWAEKCFKLAEWAYVAFGKESFRKAMIFNKHMYWNLRARRLKAEKKYEEAAECYKASAETILELDESVAYDEYSNYYKCLAIANINDLTKFIQFMEKSIDFAEKSGDEKEKYYLLGFKYEFLAKSTKKIEDRIRFLKMAKEYYYRAHNKPFGMLVEFMLYYYLSQRELRDGNYEKALSFLDRAIRMSKHVKFPNIVTSADELKAERLLYLSYLSLSQGKFVETVQFLDEWLDRQKGIENTKKYQFYKIVKFCLELLSKGSFSIDDLNAIEEQLSFIRRNNLELSVYRICSLTYAYISLWIHNIRDKKILDEIRLGIISRIIKEETVKELKRRLEVQRAIEKYDWILRLPPKLAETFDKCLYALNNTLEVYKHMAMRDFYLLLENFLKIVIEFNAQVLWPNEWKSRLEKLVTNNLKEFEKFTFGDLIRALRLLKNLDARLCKDISNEVFELLNKHLEIRNMISHEIVEKIPEVDIVGDILRIMYLLLNCFPLCIKIVDNKRKPWYHAEILWNQLPKRIILYSEQELDKKCYYIEPILEISEMEISPKVIVPASLGCI